jgi:hypothetical protein
MVRMQIQPRDFLPRLKDRDLGRVATAAADET